MIHWFPRVHFGRLILQFVVGTLWGGVDIANISLGKKLSQHQSSANLSINLSMYLPILSIPIPIHLSHHQSIQSPSYLSTHFSISPSVYPFIYLSLHPYRQPTQGIFIEYLLCLYPLKNQFLVASDKELQLDDWSWWSQTAVPSR